MKNKWENYEEVARYLLDKFADEFGLEKVEGKQKIDGLRSGTKHEIDAKGVKEGNQGFVIIECRRYTKSKQNQEKLGALAYRITDTGAEGGILVSPLGMQEGAKKIADSENILNVRLAANSTPHDFNMQFLNKLMIGLSETVTVSEHVNITISQACQNCGKEFIVNNGEVLCKSCRE